MKPLITMFRNLIVRLPNGVYQPRAAPREWRNYHDMRDDCHIPPLMMGLDYLKNPRYNKGLAFTIEERKALGIYGLLPPGYRSPGEQVRFCKINLDSLKHPLDKYIYLSSLHERNENLFYRLVAENVEQILPLVYTPTVGQACQLFGTLYRRPRGLYITIHDRGHIRQVLRNVRSQRRIRCIVVTDGERILGLGDLGAYGMGIPLGKLSLYTALARIKPHLCLPVLLDVGCNNASLLADPHYIGLKQKRVTGTAYDEFVDEFMQAVAKLYGQDCLIQFEDFANHNAHRLLDKYRDKYLMFNDDIQGTASVVLAGVLASLKITHTKLTEHRFLFLGAGGAALGVAKLLSHAVEKQHGVSPEVAAANIFLCDIDGLLVKSRQEKLPSHKDIFLKDLPQLTDFAEMVELIKPTAILGASAAKGAFTPQIIRRMAEFNERPIIFALSNPTSKAECTAEEAYVNSDGRAIFASGSPFPPWQHPDGRTFIPGQGNNAYVFPGVALGALASGIRHISDDAFLLAAETVANMVNQEDLNVGRLYPPLKDIPTVSLVIAKRMMEVAFEKGVATCYPEPKDKMRFLKEQLYSFKYPSMINV